MGDSLLLLCLLLFVDGATFAFFTTPLLLQYGKMHPPWAVALAGGAASAAGSAVQLLLLRWGLSGKHGWMRPFLPAQQKVTQALEKHPAASFLAIAVARATPLPDAPIKLAVAAGGYSVLRYGIAVYLGALPYYFALAWAGGAFKIPGWILASAAGLVVLGFAIDWLRRRGRQR